MLVRSTIGTQPVFVSVTPDISLWHLSVDLVWIGRPLFISWRWCLFPSWCTILTYIHDHLRHAYRLCTDVSLLKQILELMSPPLPRRYPTYDQPTYPRARHAEILALHILAPSDTDSPVFCTHPWQLVAKSCGRLSRLVTDASVLTRYSYGHCSESPVLAMFLHFLSQHGQGLCHLEWDFRSFFYQIPLSPSVQPMFSLQLWDVDTVHHFQHTVLPQGWRPSSAIAQTVAVVFCIVLTLRAVSGDIPCGMPLD